MITVLSGSDRVKISREVEKILGSSYEIFEGANLNAQDIMNICEGNSLFFEKRKILIRDLTPTRGAGKVEGSGGSADGSSGERATGGFDAYEEFLKYTGTEHEIVIWESTASRKKSFKDFLKAKGVQAKKFELEKPVDAGKVFEIYDLTLLDGKRAVLELRKIEAENDPYMFFGLLASQAIRKYQYSRGTKEKKILQELARLDMKTKTSAFDPWKLIEGFLIGMGN